MSESTSTNSKPGSGKMMLITWIYAYALINIVFALIGKYILDLSPLIRGAILTTLLVPAIDRHSGSASALKPGFHS